MTEGVGTDDFSTQSYPAQLQTLPGREYVVGNFGVSCATMLRNGTDAGRPFGYIIHPAMRNVIDFNPDIVMSMTANRTIRKISTVNLRQTINLS
ncbi:hypothetical protein [Muribaculum intestinale]|nr:hypothetical protein [Muribaculum intestinale]